MSLSSTQQISTKSCKVKSSGLIGGPDLAHNQLPDSLLCLQTISAFGGQKGPLSGSGCLGNAGCLPRTLCASLVAEFQKRNSIKGKQLSALLHLEFQNLHFMCQSFILQLPNRQALASDTTCLLGMFFRLHKLTGQTKNNLFKHPHYSFDAGIMKMSISQQRKLRNGKNITYLR